MNRRPRAFTSLAQACRVEATGKVAVSPGTPSARPNGWGTGIGRLAPFDWAPPTTVWSRAAAMSIPSVARCRDLLVSAISGLPLTLWTYRWQDAPGQVFQNQLPPPPWFGRPDPDKTRQYILGWTVDDLLFNGRAYWRITDRLASTYPAAFRQMPYDQVNVDSSGTVTFDGRPVDPSDVVEFCSPLDGILAVGFKTINTALQLDAAAQRFSASEIPAGWLQQRADSEPLSGDELAGIADDFQAARQSRTIAALNPYIEWHESAMDPSRLQLTEARQHQALEIARLMNIPPYLIGAPQGTGMTYANTVQAKADLIDFGALPLIATVEQTLSGPNVCPRGQVVRLDVNAFTRNPFTNATPSPNDMQTGFNTPTPEPQPVPRTPGRPRQVDGLNEGNPAA